MKAKFDFYEVVEIVSDKPELREINGMEGTVLGITQKDDGEHNYAVLVDSMEETWCVDESELTPTGRHRRRDEIYDGATVRVKVDPDTGEGSLSNNE